MVEESAQSQRDGQGGQLLLQHCPDAPVTVQKPWGGKGGVGVSGWGHTGGEGGGCSPSLTSEDDVGLRQVELVAKSKGGVLQPRVGLQLHADLHLGGTSVRGWGAGGGLRSLPTQLCCDPTVLWSLEPPTSQRRSDPVHLPALGSFPTQTFHQPTASRS